MIYRESHLNAAKQAAFELRVWGCCLAGERSFCASFGTLCAFRACHQVKTLPKADVVIVDPPRKCGLPATTVFGREIAVLLQGLRGGGAAGPDQATLHRLEDCHEVLANSVVLFRVL